MICVYCKLTRADNAAPCANCGAPSTIQAMPQNTSWNAGPQGDFSFPQHQQGSNNVASSPWQQQSSNNTLSGSSWQQQQNNNNVASNLWQQQNSNNIVSSPWQQQAPSMPQWSQVPPSPQSALSTQQWSQMPPSLQPVPTASQWLQVPPPPQPTQDAQPDAANSRLPVPYQGGMGLQQVLDNAQNINIAAPEGEEGVVYIPPMYTNPRPIIPRYRIISGFLSFVIVVLMLCGGASYYAKASGKLDLITRVITGNNPAPPNILPGNANLPDPSDQVIKGPAYNTIPSATTTTHLINSMIAAQTDRIFKPNEVFYLTYSVYPDKAGKVTIKWYINNLPYRITTSKDTLQARQGATVTTSMAYASPAEGKVEIDWNDQPAQTLFFVVRN